MLRERTKATATLTETSIVELVRDLEVNGIVAGLYDSLTTTRGPNGAVDLRARITSLGKRVQQFLKKLDSRAY